MSLASFYSSGAMTSPFGYSAGYGGFHYGTDFAHALGTPIPTPWTITVTRNGWQEAHGWYLVGQRSDGRYISFSHMNRQSTWPIGSTISKGATVGPLGTTGMSTGPHLHIQISGAGAPWIHGTETDPWPEIQAALHDQAGGGTTPFDAEEEEEDMPKNNYIAWKDSGGKQLNAIVNLGSGFFGPFESSAGSYNTDVAKAFIEGQQTVMVSESHAMAIRDACAAVRTGSK